MIKRAHRPFVGIVISLIIGILLNKFFKINFSLVALIIFVLLSGSILFYKRALVVAFFLHGIFLGLGIFLSQTQTFLPENNIVFASRFYRKTPVCIKGIIVSDIRQREFFNRKKTDFTFQVYGMKTKYGWKKVNGKLFVQIFRIVDFHYGDELFLEGKLHFPCHFSDEKNFSYKDYLSQRGIHLIFSVKKNGNVEILNEGKGHAVRLWFYKWRKKLRDIFQRYLTQNESAIMRAMILGERADIPKHINNLFSQTGTAHILAISGLHVGIVAGLFLIFLKILSLPRKCYFGLAAILLIAYAVLTGLRPSVVRATIIFVVFLFSFILDRESDPLNTLAFSAFLLLLSNPLNLFDIGFQLSFICILSIILFVPETKKVVLKIFPFKENFLHYSFATSLAVWIGSIGIILYYFNIITPVTIIANFFIIPLSSVLVALGFGLIFFSFVFSPVAVFFALSLKICLNLLVGLIFLFNKLPYAYYKIDDVTHWHIILYYIIILIIFLFWKSLSSKASRPLFSS